MFNAHWDWGVDFNEINVRYSRFTEHNDFASTIRFNHTEKRELYEFYEMQNGVTDKDTNLIYNAASASSIYSGNAPT